MLANPYGHHPVSHRVGHTICCLGQNVQSGQVITLHEDPRWKGYNRWSCLYLKQSVYGSSILLP
jgi:hypothetical protein